LPKKGSSLGYKGNFLFPIFKDLPEKGRGKTITGGGGGAHRKGEDTAHSFTNINFLVGHNQKEKESGST